MSEQPTTSRPNETRFDDGAAFDLHKSTLERNPFVRGETPEIKKSVSELAVEGIIARTNNLVWAREDTLITNGSFIKPNARLSDEGVYMARPSIPAGARQSDYELGA